MIESVAAIPNVRGMCDVDGTDVFFFGPADFSATAGYRGQWEGPGVADQIVQLKDSIQAAGKQCGLMTTSIDNLVERREDDQQKRKRPQPERAHHRGPAVAPGDDGETQTGHARK